MTSPLRSGVSGGSAFALALLLAIASVANADRLDSVAVRTWDTEADAGSFPPELEDDALRVPWLADRPSFGIAFSGGGTRSATATLGQLRALATLRWLDRARYISANSGGTWTSVPYTFLPARADEDRFLGPYVPPESISDQTLAPADQDPRAMATAIHNATTIDRLLALGRGDEAYSDIVGSIFLDPFGLHDNERLFTFHRAALAATLEGNPDLREGDFYVVEREDRPYLIVVGTMLAEQLSDDPQEYFPVEMTPLYTGIRQRFCFEKDGEEVMVGGGYVESFGYDSYEPADPPERGRYEVGLKGRLRRGDNPWSDRYRFTLSDVIGISSAAPLATLSGRKVPNLAFPELKEWPPDRAALRKARSGQRVPCRSLAGEARALGRGVRIKADEYQHADGGDIDNLAITPLLVRGVENILVFVNTADDFEEPESGCAAASHESVVDDLVSLFKETGKLVHNRVFANGEEELAALCSAFARQKARDEPLVHCRAYQVIDNPRHGIAAYRADVCFVYLDRTANWLAAIPAAGGLNRKLRAGESPFDNFPHYSTFAEQGALLIDLDRERVNALSNLTAWTVLTSAEVLRLGLATAALPPPE